MIRRFESINLVDVHETNGEEERGLLCDRPKLTVREHWNRRNFVVLSIGGTSVTVITQHLKRAIDNAQNAHK